MAILTGSFFVVAAFVVAVSAFFVAAFFMAAFFVAACVVAVAFMFCAMSSFMCWARRLISIMMNFRSFVQLAPFGMRGFVKFAELMSQTPRLAKHSRATKAIVLMC
eukprot:CAMPEP_0172904578 /NCGR_PEP_ID=MMETSP1075-20121228/172913_1 /TAXON_ID=2916 /ORGANISM="Ceratium fusus, Strain PA161109" /LENGTH=105 /DNA_ID=CAMNT_0013761647 /DNA_START=28 /DNA_END=343 /DNA_ORIENTATION=+